ncbi:glycosyltransferase family 1 protein [Pedobacter immunditicola]|uniref:glycosyltransferase family 1 protein n=1 Tax=Pedobacter immunditicola TaxID=3133440 RepID=UPI00309C5E01
MKNSSNTPPRHLLCFSHLRWDFVFQRPQHLISRFSQELNVYFLEEPIFDTDGDSFLAVCKKSAQLSIVVPHLPANLTAEEVNASMTGLLDQFFHHSNLNDWTFWYYTPMALTYSEKFKPRLTIYDCMDELTAFKFAPKELAGLEKKLMAKADLVFTGGHSLYEAKKQQHLNIFPFPSSIDKAHFAQARRLTLEPVDQAQIGGVKIGFYGVIDERFDMEVIRHIAAHRPSWQIILIGPVVKIDPQSLPQNPNIHYLGQKSYTELPRYLCGWDVALIPFQLNESTRFISPTKTPEYLAAGVPVVSTPIRDVIKPYGIKKLVHIGEKGADFVRCIELELNRSDKKQWIVKVDQFLSSVSWDDTFAQMNKLIQNQLNDTNAISIAS